MQAPPPDLRRFDSLLAVVEALRGPDGCPWDKEQTHRTLAPFAIEEAHELAEAVEGGSTKDMVGELGDVLLQVVLQAEIGRQAGTFDVHDVIGSIAAKMVRRHPHVFSDLSVKTSAEVLKNWAEGKKAERAEAGRPPTHAFEVPVALPALARAQKIGLKTQEVRFDWPDWRGVFGKVQEETGELLEACESVSSSEREHELGDLLFATAQLGRHLGLDSEQALRSANARFERRYVRMRGLIEADGQDFSKMEQTKMETYWERVKQIERSQRLASGTPSAKAPAT